MRTATPKLNGFDPKGVALLACLVACICGCSSRQSTSKWRVRKIPLSNARYVYEAELDSSQVSGVGHTASLDLSFASNKIRSPKDEPGEPGVAITAPCKTGETGNGVILRMHFDDEAVVLSHWISENGNHVIPDNGWTTNGDFVQALERHRTLRLIIPCGPFDSSDVSFHIGGLRKALISAGMKP